MNRIGRLLPLLILFLAAVLMPPTVAASDPDEALNLATGQRQVVVPRPDGSTFTALLLYPALAGNPAPLDPVGAPYPSIVFGHGYLQRADQYAGLLAHLASQGYLVIAPESGGELFPSHAAFAADMSLSLDYLHQQGSDPASWLVGGVEPARSGMSGHSMGGGAALLAAADDPRVTVVAPLAPAETVPSVIARMAQIQGRVTLIAGSDDFVTPLPIHAVPMYQGARSPRRLAVIIGGSHCGFQDVPFPICDQGGLAPAEQMAQTRRLLSDLFALYLHERVSRWPLVWGPPALTNPLVTLAADPGMRLTPRSQSGSGAPGTTLTYTLTLVNRRAAPTRFDVVALARWPTVVTPARSEPVPPGATVTFQVAVQLPASGAPTDLALISAHPTSDPLTRQFALLRSGRP